MSQVATKKKLSPLEARIRVTAHFVEEGSVLAGTARGAAERFEIELSVESDEPPDEISELLRMAHRMCFTEDVLQRNVPLTAVHLLNGRPLSQRP